MRQIKIKYYPFKKLPLALTANGQQPESWQEITPKQIITIARTHAETFSDVVFLAAMCGLRKSIVRKLDNYQRLQLSEALDFFATTHLHNAFALPWVKVKGTKYYTPKQKLKGMSFGQFIFVDTYMGLYQSKNNPDHLHKFIAALCLQSTFFNENHIEHAAKKMKKLPSATKEALVVNYLLIKAWLVKTYPLVFPEPEPNHQPKGNHEQDEPTKFTFDSNSWIKIFESLVGDNIIDRDKYAQLPVHDVLRYLSKKIKENLKRKK